MYQVLNHFMSHKNCPLAHPLNMLHDWLSKTVQWPADTSLLHLKLRRLWPSNRKGISFELLVTINTNTTTREATLQGGWLSQPRWTKPRNKATLSGNTLLGLRLLHNSQDLWVCSPDRDKSIRWSPELFDRNELAKLLSTINCHTHNSILSNIVPAHIQPRIIAYRVNRRCVVQVEMNNHDKDESVMVKAFHRLPGDYDLESMAHLHQQLHRLSHDTIKLPTTLAIDQTKRLIVSACVTNEAQPLSYTQEGVAMAGKVLANLHACEPLATNIKHTITDELDTITRWPSVLSLICKPLKQNTLSTIIEKITDQANHHEPGEPVMVHRDFYHAQLLQHKETTWLLDLDTLCIAQRELDLATFLAHLLLDNAQQNIDSQLTSELAASVISSYICHGGIANASRLAFYLSCALARLGCIHAVRGEPKSTIQHLWTLANTLLDTSAQTQCPTYLLQSVIQECS